MCFEVRSKRVACSTENSLTEIHFRLEMIAVWHFQAAAFQSATQVENLNHLSVP